MGGGLVRRRCSCPCTCPPEPGKVWVRSELVPPSTDEALAGYINRRILPDGTREVYFEPYANGKIGRPVPLPEETPETWGAAIQRAERFLTGTGVPA